MTARFENERQDAGTCADLADPIPRDWPLKVIVGSQSPPKNSGSHIDASHSRQPLVKGERLVRYEVNAVIIKIWWHAPYHPNINREHCCVVCQIESEHTTECLNSIHDPAAG